MNRLETTSGFCKHIHSYGAYLKGKKTGRLKCQRVLEHFSGSRRKRLERDREFVEEKLARGKLEPLPVLKQVFIADEEFVEQAKRKAVKNVALERSYPLKRIVPAVCRAQGVEEGEIKRPGRSEECKGLGRLFAT
jgi:hypothetical protein